MGIIVRHSAAGTSCGAQLEGLEPRRMLCADALHDGEVALAELSQVALASSGGTTNGSTNTSSGSTYPLSALPLLHSNPAAAVKLYLDFVGAPATRWGSYSVPTTPAYTVDADATTFNDTELSYIRIIWERVAEKFAPFNVDVTTQDPGSYIPGYVLRAVIGGDGQWAGGPAGISYVGGFLNSTNTVWIFSAPVSGSPQFVPETISHESGHALGLYHQSYYDANRTRLYEYNPGNYYKAPIMGGSTSSQRGLWWYGTSTSATTYQDDMAVIAGTANGFGYRGDDYGDTFAAATATQASADGSISAAGIIGRTSDRDVFGFSTAGGAVSFTAAVYSSALIGGGATLDLKLQVLDAGGNLVAMADTSALGESLSLNLAAGTYYVVVASHGSYGDVGQYWLSGNIGAPATEAVAAPSQLAAIVAGAGEVDLSWVDNSGGAAIFRIQRSGDGGTSWIDLNTAGAQAYRDMTVAAGQTYTYRVYTIVGGQSSGASNSASATLAPDAPPWLTATAISWSQVSLAWADVTGETGYVLERSADGMTWAQIALVGASVTSFTDGGMAGGSIYAYRVTAYNGGGSSLASPVAQVQTPAAPLLTPPTAPSNVVATGLGKGKMRVTWVDNADNERGFVIERSLDQTTWSVRATLGTDVASYTDASGRRGKTYFYRVKAYNDAGGSAYSAVASVVAFAPWPAPTRQTWLSLPDGQFSSLNRYLNSQGDGGDVDLDV